MEKINGDDLAYPLIVDNPMSGPYVNNGLTKREYFAAMALQGIISKYGDGIEYPERAIQLADKLILELNKH